MASIPSRFSKAQEALLDRGRLHLVDGRKSGRSVKIVAEVDYNS